MLTSNNNANLTQYSKYVFNNNKAKGFWDDYIHDPKERIPEAVALIHSEVSEMLEAHRKGHFADSSVKLNPENTDFKILFEKHVKNSVEDEFADIAIRVMDLAGALNINVDFTANTIIEYTSFFDFINLMHSMVNQAYDNQEGIAINLKAILRTLFSSEGFIKTDLMKHINLKVAYNQLRDYKHGKKY